VALEDLQTDMNFVMREIPKVVDRLQSQSGISASLCISLMGQQIASSLSKNLTSKDITGTLSELSEILRKNELGNIVTSKSDSSFFEFQECIGCENGMMHGDSLTCQLLIRIFETCLEERLDSSYVVKWSKGVESKTGNFNCIFTLQGV
jgi:hypothetical protein